MTWIKTEKISLFNIMTMKFKLGFKKKVKFGYGIKQKKIGHQINRSFFHELNRHP